MQIKKYRDYFIETLTPIYDAVEVESFFYLILEQYHQMKRIDLALQPESIFTEIQIEDWNKILAKLQQEIPIQYILGKTHFYGLDFEVDENVLIPRQETEELVEWIITNQQISKLKNQQILDIGTGSGCIAISLAKNIPAAKVSAIDVSEKALSVAQKNADLNQVDVTFIHQNILETEDLQASFDIIVSNPPYVRNLEKAEIKKNVLAHEPHLALFVEDYDALIFYRKIAELAQKNLKENGQLYFEINQYLGKEMVDLLESMGFVEVALRKDIYGNDRMIMATKLNKK
jgi:release factor glutamine methyltransferase